MALADQLVEHLANRVIRGQGLAGRRLRPWRASHTVVLAHRGDQAARRQITFLRVHLAAGRWPSPGAQSTIRAGRRGCAGSGIRQAGGMSEGAELPPRVDGQPLASLGVEVEQNYSPLDRGGLGAGLKVAEHWQPVLVGRDHTLSAPPPVSPPARLFAEPAGVPLARPARVVDSAFPVIVQPHCGAQRPATKALQIVLRETVRGIK
jgi:hypothetical protein